MNNDGYNKKKTPKRFQYTRFYKNGEVRKKLQEGKDEYFCNKKWRTSYEKQKEGLSRAAARTGKLR